MMDFDAKAREIPLFLGSSGLRLNKEESDYAVKAIAAALKEAYNAGLDDGYSAAMSGLVGTNFHHVLADKALTAKKVPI